MKASDSVGPIWIDNPTPSARGSQFWMAGLGSRATRPFPSLTTFVPFLPPSWREKEETHPDTPRWVLLVIEAALGYRTGQVPRMLTGPARSDPVSSWSSSEAQVMLSFGSD